MSVVSESCLPPQVIITAYQQHFIVSQSERFEKFYCQCNFYYTIPLRTILFLTILLWSGFRTLKKDLQTERARNKLAENLINKQIGEYCF